MDHALTAGTPTASTSADLPWRLGMVGGMLLPLIAAALYATYDISVHPLWLEGTRQLGYVWLAAEVMLIVHALRRGLDLAATWRALPRWARGAATLFLATFWISSAFVSRHPEFSMMLSLGWIVQLAFAAALSHLSAPIPAGRMANVWHGFALGLVALAVVIAVHFTWLPAPLRGWEHDIDWGNAIPGFISVRLFGAWAGAVLALLTGVAWLAEGAARRQRVVHLATALAFGMMFWSGTRAAVLGWLCVLPVAWVLAGRPRSHAFALLPAWLLAAALLAILLQPYGHPAFSFGDALDPGVNKSADAFSSLRLTFWRESLRVAINFPLLGTGAGSSWWLIPLGSHFHVQPHNAVVQFLLNWGLIPTLPALALLAGATWHAHVAVRRHRSLLPFVLMLDCLLVMSLLDGMLHFAQFIMLIVGCLAICLAPRNDLPTP